MAELPRDFGERLVSSERVDPMQLQQLREQVVAVLEQPLTRAQRIASAVGGVVLVVFTLVMLPMVARRWDELPFMAHLAVVTGFVAMPLMGLVSLGVARRGVLDKRRHGGQMISIALLVCVGMGAAYLHNGWASGDGQSVFAGAVLLVVGFGAAMMYLLEQYHLATKRKLLELELRLAEIAERLEQLSKA